MSARVSIATNLPTARAMVVTGALLAACGSDVRLGSGVDAPPPVDAPPDGMFTVGTYLLTYLDPLQVDCEGTLAGMEASFMSITRASSNLVDGSVTLSAPRTDVLEITGTPIQTAFAQATIALAPNPDALPPDFPQTIWDTVVEQDFGGGPLDTRQTHRYFGIDSSTSGTPSQMDSAVALLFTTSDMNGDCFASFGAVLATQ